MSNPTKPLTTLLDEHSRHSAFITKLEELLVNTTASRVALELSFDPQDSRAVAKLSELITLETALPRRVEGERAVHEQLEGRILKACNDFITGELNPRCRALAARARDKIKPNLAPLFDDPARLDDAIRDSDLLRQLKRLELSIQFTPAWGPVRFTRDEVLVNWARLDAVEAKLAV